MGQVVYNVPVINRNYMDVVGTKVQFKATVLQVIREAHACLKSKKTTDAEKQQAQKILRDVHLMDKAQYFTDQCIRVGTKNATEPAFVANAIVAYLRKNNLRIPTLWDYYKILPDYIRVLYNEKAEMRLKEVYGCDIDAQQLKQMKESGALFALEYLCTGAAYCVSRKTGSDGTEKVTRSLVTANLDICKTLYMNGSLQQDAEKYPNIESFMDTMENNLYSATAIKHIKAGNCTVLNLKPLSVTRGIAQYSVTKRQNPVALNDAIAGTLYPIEGCSLLHKLLTDVLKDNICELITQRDDKQEHTMALTSSADIVRMCYKTQEEDVETLLEVAHATGVWGWNAGNLRISLYRLDKEDFMLGSFYPDTVLRCNIAQTKDAYISKYLHTAENWRDCMAARMIFNTTITNLKKKDYDIFTGFIPGVENVVMRKDKKVIVLSWAIQQRDEDLYEMMENSTWGKTLFPDLRNACANRRKTMPVYLKRFTKLAIPKQATPDAVIRTYKDCMQTGVLKVVYMKKDGQIKTIKLTNNTKILSNTYGKNYVGEWETPYVRLTSALLSIKAQEFDPTIEVNVRKILVYYDVESYLFPDGYPTEVIKEQNANGVVLKSTVVKRYLCEALQALKDKKQDKVSIQCACDEITGHIADGLTLEATKNNVTFYRTLKLNTIVSAAYARMNQI